MSSWKEVAAERFPDRKFDEPVTLYIAAAKKAIGGAVAFDVQMDDRHRGFIGLEFADAVMPAVDRALSDALDAASYSAGYQAFMEDVAAGNESRLYDMLDEIETQR